LFRKYPLSFYLMGINVIFLILIAGIIGFLSFTYLTVERALQEDARVARLETENDLGAASQSGGKWLKISS